MKFFFEFFNTIYVIFLTFIRKFKTIFFEYFLKLKNDEEMINGFYIILRII